MDVPLVYPVWILDWWILLNPSLSATNCTWSFESSIEGSPDTPSKWYNRGPEYEDEMDKKESTKIDPVAAWFKNSIDDFHVFDYIFCSIDKEACHHRIPIIFMLLRAINWNELFFNVDN